MTGPTSSRLETWQKFVATFQKPVLLGDDDYETNFPDPATEQLLG